MINPITRESYTIRERKYVHVRLSPIFLKIAQLKELDLKVRFKSKEELS